jgi:hypothetical protein
MATTYNFQNHVSGDTFDGVTFHIEDNNGDIDLTGAKVEMFTDHYLNLQPILSTVNGSIVIIDESAVDSTISIPEQIISWPIGTYNYRIKITFPNGKVKTYISGTWTIIER